MDGNGSFDAAGSRPLASGAAGWDEEPPGGLLPVAGLDAVVAQAARLALASTASAVPKALFTGDPRTDGAMGGFVAPPVKRLPPQRALTFKAPHAPFRAS